MNRDNMREHYTEATGRYSALAVLAGRKLLATSMLRLVCFAGGTALIWVGFVHGVWWGMAAATIALLSFALLLRRYSRLSEQQMYYSNLADINRHEAEAMSGNCGFADGGGRYVDTRHSFSYDIDLFGDASLFRYLNRTVTGFGRYLLAKWLSNPHALAADMENRQAAVSELAGKEQWRHEFMAAGYNRHVEREDIADLNKWIDSVEKQNNHVLHRYLLAVLPVATFLSLFMAVAGVSFGYHVFSLLFFANILYVFTRLKHTNAIHSAVSKKYNYLASINKMLKVFEAEDFESHILQNIKNNMSGGGVSAAVSVRKLGRLVNTFDYRLNMLVGTVLNGFVLWDIQCIRRLEKWKSEYRACFAAWMDMLGQIDAFISLGNFAANNPGYVYPSVAAGDMFLSSVNLGHPLIDERAMVRNSFDIPHKGMAVIVTGANMAGKSTFLRTLAVNYILAMTGSPVCADRFVFRPVELFTSMRAEDSLADNESYFYAELKRLKQLKLLVESGRTVFFILDEILKGTNSTDKSIGSKMFLTKLIELGGTGVIATHDVSLSEMELSFPGKAINKCFEIEINEGKVSFDYILRPGITTKMNAALLMKQMGIVGSEQSAVEW